MKKTFLLSVLSMTFLGLSAQQMISNKAVNINQTKMNTTKKLLFKPELTESTYTTPNGTAPTVVPSTIGTTIGSTTYDLQTNGSMGRRIALRTSGISAVFTFSTELATYSDRGTGFQYFNGTSWLPSPTARVETTTRCGFPSLGTSATGADMIVAHKAAPYNLALSTNSTFGSSTWTSVYGTPFPMNDATKEGIWPRIANSGNNVYIIDGRATVDASNVPVPDPVSGVKGMVYFSRSQDNGVTWDIDHLRLPFVDSTRFDNIGGDTYAIDAHGSLVSIVIAGMGQDLVLLHSTDNGTTFTKTVIDSYSTVVGSTNYDLSPAANYLTPDANGDATLDINDAILSNDGAVSVLIDNAGVTHVTFSNVWTLVDDTSAATGGVSYFPLATGLISYWNSTMAPNNWVIPANWVSDLSNNVNCIDTATTPSIGRNHFLAGSSTDMDGIYPGQGLMTCPTIAIDTTTNLLYIVFQCVMPGDTSYVTCPSGIDGQNYSDIMALELDPVALTVSPYANLTKTWLDEEAFPTVAKYVDGNIHMIWQEDKEPGTTLQNGDPAGTNYIKYFKISLSDFATLASDPNPMCNIANAVVPPVANFTIVWNNDGTYTLVNTSTGNPTNFVWGVGSSIDSTTISPTYTYSGLINLCLTVSNEAGASNFCVNNFADIQDDIFSQSISIAPNPAYQFLNVETEVSGNYTYTIQNTKGQTVLNGELTNKTIDISNLSQDLYFITISNESKSTVKRFTVAH